MQSKKIFFLLALVILLQSPLLLTAQTCLISTDCAVGYTCNPQGVCTDCSQTDPLCEECSFDSFENLQCDACLPYITYLDPSSRKCILATSIDQNAVNVTLVNGVPEITCAAGFYKVSDTNQTCISCYTVFFAVQSCATDSNGVPYITQCYLGYYITADLQQCIYCNVLYAQSCHLEGNIVVIDSCQQGLFYEASNNTCIYCSLLQPSYISQCTITNNIVTIISCYQGFFLNSLGVCQQCSNYYNSSLGVLNCAICAPPPADAVIPICQACYSGYYLDTVSNICVNCPINSCLLCQVQGDASLNNTIQCTQCYEGYALINGTCVSCSAPNCEECISNEQQTNQQCTFCNFGYYLSSAQQCESCQDQIQQCAYCKTSNSQPQCVYCNYGYYLTADSLYCVSCTTLDPLCQYCYLLAGVPTCSYCGPGYYVATNNVCTNCTTIDPLCTYCYQDINTNQGQCESCSGINYVLNNTCLSCDTIALNCTFCYSYSGQNYCSCNQGYFVQALGECVSCGSFDPYCLGCYLQGEVPTCYTCDIGYYLDQSNQCQACESLEQNCIQCYLSTYPSSRLYCYACAEGSYLTSNYTCSPCAQVDQNCEQCQFNGTASLCQVCFDGYYLSDNGLCEACNTQITNCLTCTYTNSTIYCDYCAAGYYQDNGACNACSIDNCTNCVSNIDACADCDIGYYLSQDQLSCQPCSWLYPECIQCGPSLNNNMIVCSLNQSSSNGTVQPIVCNAGFYYLPIAEQCLPCSQLDVQCTACSIVNTVAVCSQCSIGYYNAWWNHCEACSAHINNCSACYKGSDYLPHCSTCTAGNFLTAAGTCAQCTETQATCSACSADGSGTLTCPVCIQNGTYTDSQGVCVACTTVDQQCVACHLHCSTAVCDQCTDGWYVPYFQTNSRQCVLCSETIANCSFCTQSNQTVTCVDCQDGYYLSDNGTCIACTSINSNSNCQSCAWSIQGPVCISCQSNQYLNSNNICAPCTDANFLCSTCQLQSLGQLTCLKCELGFVVYNNTCAFDFGLSDQRLYFAQLFAVALTLALTLF